MELAVLVAQVDQEEPAAQLVLAVLAAQLVLAVLEVQADLVVAVVAAHLAASVMVKVRSETILLVAVVVPVFLEVQLGPAFRADSVAQAPLELLMLVALVQLVMMGVLLVELVVT